MLSAMKEKCILVSLPKNFAWAQYPHHRRVIMLYLEYQSVCPFVRIELTPSAHPLLQASVSPPLEGAGRANSDDWRESLALCSPPKL
jgi:hypothetical protein